ncbi:MAG: adenylate/guanylate cyclase domain-containing protein [Flavobacteriales bacterium]
MHFLPPERYHHAAAYLSLVVAGLLFGQQAIPQGNVDSLRTVWNDTTRPDTVRLKALHHLGNDVYLFSQPDSAEYFAHQEFAFAKARGLKKFMGLALNLEGISLAIRGDLSDALDRFKLSEDLFKELHDTMQVASALNNIGLVHNDLGQKALAIEALTSSLKIAEQFGDSSLVARTLGNIGIIYFDIGDNQHAMEYYEKRLAIASVIKEWKIVAEVLNNIAIIRIMEADTAQAMTLYERSIVLCDSLDYGRQLVASICNLAGLQWGKKNVAAAEAGYQRAFALCEQLGDDDNMANSLMGIGIIARERGDDRKALASFTRALALAQGTGSVRNTQGAAELLYEMYKDQGRMEDALKMHELYITMKDSSTSEENKRGVMGQRFQYEFEKKEALLSAEQEKKDAVAAEELRRKNLQRNAFIGGFGLMVLLAGVFFVQRNRINKEKKRSEELLLNILPEEVAEELKAKGSAEAVHIDQVTVLFTDFKGFTAMSEVLSPRDLVRDLNECFSAFDHITGKYGIEKIKTIGDAYMAAGGLPTPNTTHATDVIRAALEMRNFIAEGKARKIAAGLPYFEIRIGIHTGPVVAGIVGVKKFSYDIWGDTVNTASRMESSGEVGQVNISEATHALVKDTTGFTFTPRGKVQAKGKGEMEMYFVTQA